MQNEKLIIDKNPYAHKKRNFKNNNKFEEKKNNEDQNYQGNNKPYGNTYGRKG